MKVSIRNQAILGARSLSTMRSSVCVRSERASQFEPEKRHGLYLRFGSGKPARRESPQACHFGSKFIELVLELLNTSRKFFKLDFEQPCVAFCLAQTFQPIVLLFYCLRNFSSGLVDTWGVFPELGDEILLLNEKSKELGAGFFRKGIFAVRSRA